MFWRLIFFLLALCAGALLGLVSARAAGLENAWVGAFFGLMAGSVAWVLTDLLRSAKLLRWLRSSDQAGPGGISPGGIWGEVFDRTRRQVRARDQLTLASDLRLQDFLAALQTSPGGMVLLDRESRIEWFNQTATLHFGFEAHRDLSQHIGNLVRDPAFAAYFAGHDFRRDVVIPGREDAQSRPVKLAVQLHLYGDGRLLLLSRDITAVEQAEAMRRDFVANVSHEIRTPLTVLSGFVETLQTLNLSEEERVRYLDLMAQQAHRMQTLVNDLLTLSRLEGSPPVGAGAWLPVRQLVEQASQEARSLALVLDRPNRAVHDIQVDTGPPCEIAGDASELSSAMTNLACNAIRHTPGGSILIQWRRLDDGRGEFSVQDTGPGIAAEHIPRLTERFYRVDRSRSRETGGTGLGLAIVKHVSQRHGAEFNIKSTPGKGSRFSIVFSGNRVRFAEAAPRVNGIEAPAWPRGKESDKELLP